MLAETTDVGGEDAEEWAKSAQNFLICLEMLLFSIAHFYCFPTDEWEEGYKIKHSHGFGDTVALGDFVSDIKLILRYVFSMQAAVDGVGRSQNVAASSRCLSLFVSLLRSSSSNPKKKKKKEAAQPPTIPEASTEEDDDDTEAVSVATSNAEEFDVEKAVAEALEESLGICGDDPDIIEAKKRLLASKVLSPAHFDVGNANFAFSSSEDDEYEEEDESECVDTTGAKDDGHKLTTPRSRDAEQHGGVEEEKEAEDDVPTETTPLRPSIFTTVASIAEKEEQADRLNRSLHSGGSEDESYRKGEKLE